MAELSVKADKAFVSIVVISKDDIEGLSKTLLSIAMQENKFYEVIIVAKGTSTQIDVNNFGISSWVLITQESGGISAAFNLGINAGKADWINFLNGGDAYFNSSVLDNVSEIICNRPHVKILTARALDIDTKVSIPRDLSFQNRNQELISHQASFFRRSLFREYGNYSEEYQIRMDFEWMLRIPASVSIAWIDVIWVLFQGSGISSSKPTKSSLEEICALARHRRGLLRLAVVFFLYFPWRLGRAVLRRSARARG